MSGPLDDGSEVRSLGNYRAVTLYFTTGTGNSLRGATWMADSARASGATVHLTQMEDAQPAQEIEPGPGQLLGIVAPTHGFTAPWSVIRFALRLPRGAKTHAFVAFGRAGMKIGPFFVSGLEGSACYLIALILALKGYCVRGNHALDLPSNWLSLHPGFSRKTAEAMVARQQVLTSKFIERILSGRRWFGGFGNLIFGMTISPISIGYLLVGRFFLAKLFFSSNRCNGCGICDRACPRNAIRMWGKEPRPYWTLDCESCMRCMAFCPRKAVQAGHSLAALFVYLVGLLPFERLIMDLLRAHAPALAASSWVSASVWSTCLMVVVVAAYPLFALLLRFRLVNALFTYTTLTRLPFWTRYREPQTKLKALLRRHAKLPEGAKPAGDES